MRGSNCKASTGKISIGVFDKYLLVGLSHKQELVHIWRFEVLYF